MKIAVTTSGRNLEAPLDARFGRAARFLIYDSESGAIELIENEQNLQAAQGAGIQAAEAVARSGAGALITGHCGPKAYRVLTAAGIQVYLSGPGTVGEALERWRGAQLKPLAAADVEGHWA